MHPEEGIIIIIGEEGAHTHAMPECLFFSF